MKNVIQISRHLTSAEFYDVVLKEVNHLKYVHREDNPIILDFSITEKVEPLVIPNLLFLGKKINGETGTRMVIRIPETAKAGKLKFYMNEIDFLELAKNNIYDFEEDPYNGMDGKKIDPICGSLFFSKKLTKAEIINGILGYVSPFTEKYLDKYIEYSYEEKMYINKIDHFLYEIVDNSRIRGISDSFMTIQARYSDRKIYISVADAGVGFLQSWNINEKEDDAKNVENYLLGNRPPKDELEAILCGVYKRSSSRVYGLYSILKQTLELQGKMRIHSNTTQIIFTQRILDSLENKELLNNNNFLQWNVRREVPFRGVHIELEIPF